MHKHDIILITKDGCQKCDYVKGKIPEHIKDDIQMVDGETPDGMMHLAYNELISQESFPFLIVDGVVFNGAIKIKNKLDELGNNGR